MKSLSTAAYLQHVTHAYPGSGDSFWIKNELRSVVRMPTFCLTPPAPGEIERLLWRRAMMVTSYVTAPTPDKAANTWLYECRAYDAAKLNKTARYDLNRAQKALRFEFVSWDTILEHGMQAYCDTRTRVGLSDGTADAFRRRFDGFSRIPGHQAAAAWKDDQLVAFVALIVVNNAVEIEGSFSTTANRDTRPNDGLCNFLLDTFLVQNGYEVVSYGLSSVQPDSNEEGLHHFKRKVGFDSVPVHRVFVLHPLLRPLMNRWTLRTMTALLRRDQGNRILKKAVGMLSLVLGESGHEVPSV